MRFKLQIPNPAFKKRGRKAWSPDKQGKGATFYITCTDNKKCKRQKYDVSWLLVTP